MRDRKPVLGWHKENLRSVDWWMLKLLRIHMAIQFKEEKVRLYAKRKDIRRIISIGICVGNAKRLFENCIQQCYENTLKKKRFNLNTCCISIAVQPPANISVRMFWFGKVYRRVKQNQQIAFKF